MPFSVNILRYDTMEDDLKEESKVLQNVQEQSSCRGLAVIADERGYLTLDGDKTLISAVIGSKLDLFYKAALEKQLDKVSSFSLLFAFFCFL